MRIATRVLAFLVLLIAMLIPAGAASADPAETSKQFTFTFGINTCTDDDVVVEGTGTVHIVAKEQKEGNWQSTHTYGRGVSSQGDRYVFNSNTVFRSESNIVADFDFRERLMLVSLGSGSNQVIYVHFNQDGLIRFETDCRG